MTKVFQKVCGNMELQAKKCACVQPPTEILWMTVSSKIPASIAIARIEQPAEAQRHFTRVGWLDIGPAATRPSRSVAKALHWLCLSHK